MNFYSFQKFNTHTIDKKIQNFLSIKKIKKYSKDLKIYRNRIYIGFSNKIRWRKTNAHIRNFTWKRQFQIELKT